MSLFDLIMTALHAQAPQSPFATAPLPEGDHSFLSLIGDYQHQQEEAQIVGTQSGDVG